MTAEHALQSCPQHALTRTRFWPTPTTLNAKLYGNLGDLIAADIEAVSLLQLMYEDTNAEEEDHDFQFKNDKIN